MKTLITIAWLFSTAFAYAQHKHVHGEGQLNVALDKDTLTLELTLPLDAAVGFERAPKNDKEKASLATAVKILNETALLFIPTPTAQCTLESAQAHVPFTGQADMHDHAHEGETHHTDITASYVFRCTAAAELKSIETRLFKHFKRLYRLETQRVGPTGQSAQRLTPKKPIITW